MLARGIRHPEGSPTRQSGALPYARPSGDDDVSVDDEDDGVDDDADDEDGGDDDDADDGVDYGVEFGCRFLITMYLQWLHTMR